jgi:hypothetical protein
MAISSAQSIFGTQASGTATRPGISGTLTLGLPASGMIFQDAGSVFTGRAVLDDTDECTVDFADFAATPAGAKSFEALLEPTGAENDILLTDASGTRTTASIAIDDDTDRTQLTITADTPLVEIVSGDKRVMRIVGTLTSDGSTPVVFPILPYTGITDGKPAYEQSLGNAALWVTDDGVNFEWEIASGGGVWRSDEDVATPDLVTTWTPISPTTGTPTVTAHPATAAQVIAAITAAEIEGLTASNAPGSDGTGFVAAATADFEIQITPGWLPPQVDFQGIPYATNAEILAIQVSCTSGELTMEIDGETTNIEAGGKVQIANPSGIYSTADDLKLTASADNTTADVAIIGKL